MTVDVASLVSDNLDIWTGAVERKSGAGRGGGKRINLYGIDRLRELILDLAVRGKLVSQDVEDEPASELLKKIGAERAKLTKAGVIGKRKAADGNSDAAPYPIPEGWAWTKIADIGHDWGQKEPSGDFTYVDVGSIDQSAGVIRSPNVMSAVEAPSRARKIVKVGTVIYSTVRPYLLNIAIVDQDFDPEPIASTAFAIVHPFEGVAASFLYRYLRSATFIAYVEACQTGIAYPAINDKQFFSAWFPLPPIAEQQRIVAKVDELMALCDALEGESAAAMAAHQVLVETLLATLTDSTNAADLAANWARLEAHFDSLFTTEASVDALKQTILELAVRGKLVPQDTTEEPASELLREISARLKQSGKRTKAEWPDIEVAEVPFALPCNWAWARFGQIAQIRAELVQPQKHQDAIQIAPDVIEKGSGKLLAVRTVAQSGIRGPNSRFYAGQIIYSKIRPSLSKAVIADFDGLCSADMYPLDAQIDRSFLLRLILSEVFLRQVRIAENRIKMPKLNKESLNGFVLPIPPLAEQQRIVVKIDELMALCDVLKSRITDVASSQRHLADAVIERAAA